MIFSKKNQWRPTKLRGQAMVEYSLISHALLIGGGLGLMPIIAKLYEGLDLYYKSIFFVLTSGAI